MSLGPETLLICFFLFVLLFFFFVFSFLSLLLIEKACFLPQKGHFCLFLSVSLSFSLIFCGLPLFQFLFLCLSLVILFLSSFLSFFFTFFWFLVFVSFFPFLSSLLLFHERNNMQIFNYNVFFHQSVLFLLVFLSCFLSSNPFFLSLPFPDFKLCFCSTSMFLVSEQTSKTKNTNFWSRGGCNKTVFLSICVLQNVKSHSFRLALFWWQCFLVDVQKAL